MRKCLKPIEVLIALIGLVLLLLVTIILFVLSLIDYVTARINDGTRSKIEKGEDGRYRTRD